DLQDSARKPGKFRCGASPAASYEPGAALLWHRRPSLSTDLARAWAPLWEQRSEEVSGLYLFRAESGRRAVLGHHCAYGEFRNLGHHSPGRQLFSELASCVAWNRSSCRLKRFDHYQHQYEGQQNNGCFVEPTVVAMVALI